MAQVANLNNKDDETQFSQAQGQPSGSASTQQPPSTSYSSGGGAASSGGSSAPTAAATPSSAPAQSQDQQAYSQAGSFHNIASLLNANQGKGQQIAQQATSTAGSLAGAAQQAANQGYSQYQSDVSAGTPAGQHYSTSTSAVAPTDTTSGNAETNGFFRAAVPGNSGTQLAAGTSSAPTTGGVTSASSIFDRLKSSIAPATQTPAQAGAAAASALPSATDPTLVAQANQTYKGPSSLTTDTSVDNSGIANKIAAAQDANNALGTKGGVASTLGESGGVGALDELLARQGGGAQALNNQRSAFQGIQNQLNTATTDPGLGAAAKATVDSQAANANAAIASRTQDANTASAAAQAAVTAKQNQTTQDAASYQTFLNGLKKAGASAAGLPSLANGGRGVYKLPPGVNMNIFGQYSPDDMQKIYDYNVKAGIIDGKTGQVNQAGVTSSRSI